MYFAYSAWMQASPEAIFEVIADVDRKHEWVSEVISSRVTSEGPLRSGSTFVDRVRFMGRTSDVETVFTDYQPGQRVAYRHISGPIKAELSYDLRAEGDGTQVDIAIEAQLPFFLRPFTPLLKGKMTKQMDGNFEALKRAVLQHTPTQI